VGDFNGDGFDDVAFCAPQSQSGTSNYNGWVHVYAGNAQLMDTPVDNDDPTLPGISGNLLLKLSPNPITRAGQVLIIDLKGTSLTGTDELVVEIFNIKGQYVLKEVFNNQIWAKTLQVAASSLSNGIYICRVTSGNHQVINKFSVIK